ncbi:17093_t:CDS:2, partial [Cetraspora pellucida]
VTRGNFTDGREPLNDSDEVEQGSDADSKDCVIHRCHAPVYISDAVVAS